MNKKIPIVIAIIALFAVSSISLAGATTSIVSQSSYSRNHIKSALPSEATYGLTVL